jgi:HSP20 family protein
LPENSITDKIDAKYENGILRLSLPKKEVTVSKPVKEIKVS